MLSQKRINRKKTGLDIVAIITLFILSFFFFRSTFVLDLISKLFTWRNVIITAFALIFFAGVYSNIFERKTIKEIKGAPEEDDEYDTSGFVVPEDK